MRWLSTFTQQSLYPGSPHQRKILGASLLKALLEAWQHEGDWTASQSAKNHKHSILSPLIFQTHWGSARIFDGQLLTKQTSDALLGSHYAILTSHPCIVLYADT